MNRIAALGLALLGIGVSAACADTTVSVEASGTGGPIREKWDSSDFGRASAVTASLADTWRPGPMGGADGATGYNFGAKAWGEAGPGYIRAGAHVQMLASYLDYGSHPLARARATSTAYFRDVTFAGPAYGATVSTALRLNVSGTAASWMNNNYSSVPLDGASDNAYGSIHMSVYVTDVTNPSKPVYLNEFTGQWNWSWDQIGYGPTAPWGLVGWGSGILDDWSSNRSLVLPFDVLAGHRYQISMGMSVEARAETDGFIQADSIGLFDHSAVLDATPFALPAGVTVNSLDAGITDNVFQGAPPPLVPEPAGVGAVAAGIAGLARRRR